VKYTYLLLLALSFGFTCSFQSKAQCPIANACAPGNATNPSAGIFGGGIYQVKIGNTFVNNSGGAADGYKDYCSLGAVNVSLGAPFTIYVKTGNNIAENLKVFIDVNNDQTFNTPDEQFFLSTNAKIHSGSITIPSGATGQQLKLRITSDLINSATLPGACSTPEFSQVEDYAIILQQNVNPPVAQFIVSDTLSCSGLVTFTDQSVNNPTSWNWSFGDGEVSTSQNPVHQYLTPGLFTIKLKVASANGIDSLIRQNYVRFNDTVPVAAGCAPVTINQCCGYGISRFVLNSIDNSSTLGSYQNFTCTQRTTLLQGRSYPVQIGTNPNQNQDTRIWIDYNNNGSFDASELVFESLDSKNPVGNILISNDTSVKKNKALRLRVVSEFTGGVVDPCSNLDKGQCEDYTVYMKENTLPPVASFQVVSQNFCQPTFDFNSTSTNVILFYHWYFGDGSDTVTLGGTVSHTYGQTGIFNVSLVAVGPFGQDSIFVGNAVTYYGAPINSCNITTQAGGPQFGTGIAEVSFGSIFNRTANATEGYQNFTCTKQTTVLVGQNVPLTVRNSGNQVEKVRVWIDWNKNGTLETSEIVMDSQSDTVHTALVAIPANASLNGTLRMRVASNFQNAGQLNSCGTIQLGQAEDYGVIVIANSVKPTPVFGVDKTISCTGIVQFSDSSQNLPTSWLWKFGDGQTSTEPNPQHTYSSIGLYTVTLIVTNEFGTDSLVKSNFVRVNNTTGMVAAACIPPANTTCCQYGIEQVIFAGINQTSSGASEGYRDFTCGTVGSAPIGTSQNITIVNFGTNTENAGVWIDWNNDGSFSDAELVFTSTGATSHGGTINIPGNAPAGVGLRMRVVSDFSNIPLAGACNALQFGQVEDYQIILQGNNQPPVSLFSASEVLSCSGIISFTDTSFNAPATWKWYFGDGDSATVRNPSHTYTSAGVYTVKLIVSNANGSDTLEKISYITILDGKNLKPANCTPLTINTVNNQGAGIQSVVFNTINRQSAVAPAENYVDASCANRTSVIMGSTYSLTVQTNSNFPESCRAWIDWNNNGQFEDPAERVLNGQNSQTHTANIVVPVTAVVDTALRMRVLSDFGGGGPGANILPCSNPNFGQCEDYAVLVQQNTTPPIAHISTINTNSCNGFVQFTDSSEFLPLSWFWSFGDGQTSTIKNPLHQYSSTGTYTVKLKVQNNFGVDSVELPNYVTVSGLTGPKPANCVNTVAAPGQTNGITRVRFGDMDITSGLAFEEGGYLDKTCSDSALIVVTNTNQTNQLIINTSAGNTRENCRVYIDFNNDGFLAANESVMNSQNNNVHNANILLTQARCVGVPVRMRVLTDIRFNAITSACYNSQQGQVEDYRVRLVWAVGNQDLISSDLVSLYPNPSNTGRFTLDGQGQMITGWKILNIQGKELVSHAESGLTEPISLDFSALASGVYQIQVMTNSGLINKKIVIQK
jgi:PKD repeat protein